MTNTTAGPSAAPRSLRLWPGVVLVIAQWVVAYLLPPLTDGVEVFGLPLGVIALLTGVACGVAILVWWLLFSRAPWLERLGAVALMIAGILVTKRLVDPSIAGAGQGMLMYIATIPGLCLALVAWAVVTRRLAPGPRRALLAAAVVLACAPWTLMRTAGIVGGAGSEYHWRWTPTPEQRLLADANDEPRPLPPESAAPETPKVEPPPTASAAAAGPEVQPKAASQGEAKGDAPAVSKKTATATADRSADRQPDAASSARDRTNDRIDWPGFRGPNRDDIIHGVRINTDWSQSPPVQLWKRPIGPGWSSFAVAGDLLYTQEQRGDDEIVSCYHVSTGEPVWRHRDRARFWESNGGAGPRATPTLYEGRVYTFGATGIVNALDARTGRVLWTRNAAADTKRRTPDWGFASSPLVFENLVIVAVSGTLTAYDRQSGQQRWVGPQHGGSYSSPHLTTIDGVPQVVLLHGAGATSVAPATGELLWEYEWPGSAIVQPAVTADGDIVINSIASTGGLGTRRLAVTHGDGGWQVEERWTSTGLKPYFNDFVVHNGYAFGFDGSILSCINLADGKRVWKGGRYGNGQMILLPDQDLLLVLSEEGELALVSATADGFKEVARLPAVLDGKTWNHPVLVGDRLLVRNGQEMAAYRLSLAQPASTER